MHREIKFRGRTSSGNWVYGDYFKHPTPDEEVQHCIRVYSPDLIGYSDYVVDAKTVGQFVDLSDKNGKEIFEGDIVAFPYITPMGDIGDNEGEYSYYGEVKYGLGRFFIKPIKSDSGFWNDIEPRCFEKLNVYIIGNIYQNPELLNK